MSYETWKIVLGASAALVLFVFGLQGFSREIEKYFGDYLRRRSKDTGKIPLLSVLFGALATMVVQSSSATTAIAVALVSSGVLPLRNTIGIIIGANIGTTFTAQLVAWKLTDFGPVFIIIGFLLSLIPSRWVPVGKAIFFFGLVFFGLDAIGDVLTPLRDDPDVMGFLHRHDSVLWGLLSGFLVTALVQSSSVVTGLTIVFAQSGLLNLDQGVAICMGANIGTTLTAQLAALGLDSNSKKAALAHTIFNVFGVVLVFPWISQFVQLIKGISQDPAQELAAAHLIFNLAAAFVFLVLFQPFYSLIKKTYTDGDDPIGSYLTQPIAPLPKGPNEGRVYFVFVETFELLRAVRELSHQFLNRVEYSRRDFQDLLRIFQIFDHRYQELLSRIITLSQAEGGSTHYRQVALLLRMSDFARQMVQSIVNQVRNQVQKNPSIEFPFLKDQLFQDINLHLNSLFLMILAYKDGPNPQLRQHEHHSNESLGLKITEGFNDAFATEDPHDRALKLSFLSVVQSLKGKIHEFVHLLDEFHQTSPAFQDSIRQTGDANSS